MTEYITNLCRNCGHRIRMFKKKQTYLNEMLETAKHAICKDCDNKSSWKRY